MAHESALTNVVEAAAVIGVNPDALRGVRVAITGHLSTPRKEFEKLIADAGGVFDKTVTYGTTYLCSNLDWTNTNGGTSSKFDKAKKMGVKIISEAKLLEMMTKNEE